MNSNITNIHLGAIVLLILCPMLASSFTICDNCLNSACNYTCSANPCQAYSFTPACANAPCIGGYCCITSYYISYSAVTQNYTYCVACNYTYPGCVTCSYQDFCTQCAPEYMLQGGQCYKSNGELVGYTNPVHSIAIAFVVIFAVLGLFFAALCIWKIKRGDRVPVSYPPESPRRNTELVQS